MIGLSWYLCANFWIGLRYVQDGHLLTEFFNLHLLSSPSSASATSTTSYSSSFTLLTLLSFALLHVKIKCQYYILMMKNW